MRHRPTVAILALAAALVLTSPSPGNPLPRVAVAEASAPEEDARALWVPPVSGVLTVVTPFRAPPHQYGAGHRGIDLTATAGDTVVAPASGTVSFVGTVVDRPVVSVRVDADTVVSLEPVASALAAGDAVHPGDPLGTVAHGGHCDTGCVHLGVRVTGVYVNPLRYFRYRPVLLPWDE